METNQMSKRIHPLMAVAAASVVLVSLLGAAAMTGILPNSRANVGDAPPVAMQPAQVDPVRTSAQQNTAHNSVVHQPARQVEASQQVAQAPAQPQASPAAKNSPLGIGIGAVVGGVLGNQVGGGNGKTLATIAGAVGGGYVGNEIAKKNQ